MSQSKINNEKVNMTFENGGHFEGTLKDGMFHTGKGLNIYMNGDRFEGKWKDGKFHNGEGEFHFENGDYFKGKWKNAKFHTGKGEYHFENGDFFIGEWKDGSFHSGKVTKKDGSVEEGKFVNGRLHGEGKIIENKNVWEGEFVDGKLHGKGTIIISDFSKSEGQFEEGYFINGVWTDLETSTKYISDKCGGRGFFSYNAMDGGLGCCWPAYYISPKFVDYMGPFEADAPKIVYDNGNVYEGETIYQEGGYEGKSEPPHPALHVSTLAELIKLRNTSGCAIRNLPHGFGKLTFKNGDVFTGQFEFGELATKQKGTLTFKNGTVLEGEFSPKRWEEKLMREHPMYYYKALGNNCFEKKYIWWMRNTDNWIRVFYRPIYYCRKATKTWMNGEVWTANTFGYFKSSGKFCNDELEWFPASDCASGWITVHKKHSEPLYRGHTETVTAEGEHKVTWTHKLMSVWSQTRRLSCSRGHMSTLYTSGWSLNVYEVTPEKELTNFYTIMKEFESKSKKEKNEIKKRIKAEFGKYMQSNVDKTLAKPLLQTEGEGEEEIDPKMPPGCVGQVKTKCATAGVKAGVGLVMAAAI